MSGFYKCHLTCKRSKEHDSESSRMSSVTPGVCRTRGGKRGRDGLSSGLFGVDVSVPKEG